MRRLWSITATVCQRPGSATRVLWEPPSTGKEKPGMVHSVSGWTRGVKVKLWDPLRTRAIPERLRDVITTRRYTNPRLPLPLPYYRNDSCRHHVGIFFHGLISVSLCFCHCTYALTYWSIQLHHVVGWGGDRWRAADSRENN